MYYRDIARILGKLLLGLSLTFLIPAALAGYYEFFTDNLRHPQPHSTAVFLYSMLITLGVALGLLQIGKNATGHIYRREGLLTVVLIWLLIPVFAGLPFWLSGTLENPVMAYFEAVSGITTTGSTAMQGKAYDPNTNHEIPIVRTVKGTIDTVYTFYGTIEPVRDPKTGQILYEGVEAVGKALIFWRSFTQWLGGVGIVVLMIAVLPSLGAGGKVLFQAEVPGPLKDTLTPRLRETGINLVKIYLAVSLFCFLILLFTNSKISFFDAINITFVTISTGGFSTHNTSIAFFENPLTDWVVILCMTLGSLNFTLYYYLWKGKFYRIFQAELFVFLAIFLIASLFATWHLEGTAKVSLMPPSQELFTFWEAFRYATFQVSSAMSTTGLFTANYDIWPYLSQVVMLLVMFAGGMAGSTAGGIKTMRLLMFFRIAQYKVESLFKPKSVQIFKVGDKEVDHGAQLLTLCFFLLLVMVSLIGTFLYVIGGIDPETAIGLTACMVNGTGLSFRVAGPLDSCAFLSDGGLVISSLLMLFGRLEFFAFFALMVPSFWKSND